MQEHIIYAGNWFNWLFFYILIKMINLKKRNEKILNVNDKFQGINR